MNKKVKRVSILTAIILWMWPLVISLQQVSAAYLTSRSVTVGSTVPGANNTHLFRFTFPTAQSVGSIAFSYCSNSPIVTVSCTAPAGFSLNSASLASQTGQTGFSIHGNTTVNRMVLTRTPAVTSTGVATYQLSGVVNQSFAGTVYVRIATFASTDGSGARLDEGSVAYATYGGLGVDGYVPPYLTFCAGVTVALNCSSTVGSLLDFGELSEFEPKFATSQFSGSTNDPAGFTTSVTGLTMTSGNNTIPALSTRTVSVPGTSQFGMNLRANSLPSAGLDPTGPGTVAPIADMNVPNEYQFANQVIVSSPISTDFRRFTATYVVNISEDQEPGVYSTTLTFIAVAAF